MRSRLRVVWLLVAVALLVGAVPARRALMEQRRDHNLGLETGALEAPPPELGFALSMGVFRSMLVQVLWMRAAEMQRDKRFYELVQLYDLIGKLQPHNGMVWAYAAWNMSYNISVEIPSSRERWRWVQNGLDRLRFHGLRYNPDNMLLYWELAWIYFHKIGKNMDDSHLYYKTELAGDIQNTFGAFKDMQAGSVRAALSGNGESGAARAVAASLRANYAMDINLMADTEEDPRFGPLDWRIPETHAIYWARQGLIKGHYGKRRVDLERILYQSLQHLLRQGMLIYFPAQNDAPAHVVSWPDYRQVWAIVRMFESQVELFAREKASDVGVRSAFHYFLQEALEILFIAGQENEAEKLFRYASEHFPGATSGASDLREYVSSTTAKRIKDMSGDQFSALVSSLLVQHFWWLGRGDEKRSAALLTRAQELWKLNAQLNPRAPRQINASFEDLEKGTIHAIAAGRIFHPEIMARLRLVLPEYLRRVLEESLASPAATASKPPAPGEAPGREAGP